MQTGSGPKPPASPEEGRAHRQQGWGALEANWKPNPGNPGRADTASLRLDAEGRGRVQSRDPLGYRQSQILQQGFPLVGPEGLAEEMGDECSAP